MNLLDITGKTVLITRGSHGLGMSMAKGLVHAGAKIVVNDLSQQGLNKAITEYKSVGIEAYGYVFDVTDEASVIDSINKIEAEVAPIDILINNARIIKITPIIEKEVDSAEVINVDLISPFIISKNVAKGMIERGGGKIINICSMMSKLGRYSVSAHAAAKGGLKMLTKNMATEWGKFNIQINGISTSSFPTGKTSENSWGDSKDIQDVAIFLSSKASDFVNGHILYVDGGILVTIEIPSNE